MLGIRRKVAQTAKRAGFLTGGLLLCSVGAGFLTVAGWMTLLPLVGMASTALIVACIYIGLGLIFVAMGASGGDDAPQAQVNHHANSQQAPPTGGPPIMQAFLFGLQAGATADKKKN